jgi:hypothetical protein
MTAHSRKMPGLRVEFELKDRIAAERRNEDEAVAPIDTDRMRVPSCRNDLQRFAAIAVCVDRVDADDTRVIRRREQIAPVTSSEM